MESYQNITINLSFKPSGEFVKNLLLKTFDFLLYNRSQIPFTVEILQHFVNKGTENDYKKIGQKHKAQQTYNNILEVKQLIDEEFFNTKSFLIIFGSTIMTAKEAIWIKFPTITNCIFPSYLNELSIQKKILLQLIQSENFKNLFSNPLSITNAFILFEQFDDENLSKGLCKIKNFKLNKSCKKYAISFNHSSDFEIFCEDLQDLNLAFEDEEVWYQSKIFIKGFNKIAESPI
ncbi:unnamed protein product [Chironomus riparius]|uniref:Uncharacterized protein n=1 Tax=Chironomus riparius TaxID=315576 RepID=A0A9N9WTD4_9DIPT|nr:unnamed protein product [Chironomus riparius]